MRLELERAERVAASQLTRLECRRVLARLTPELDARSNAALRQMLFDAVQRWVLVDVDQSVRARAGEPFPVEPVRALYAIRLATCLEIEHALGPVTVLSVDQRVRDNALRLGLRVVPEALAPAGRRATPLPVPDHDAQLEGTSWSLRESVKSLCWRPASAGPSTDSFASTRRRRGALGGLVYLRSSQREVTIGS